MEGILPSERLLSVFRNKPDPVLLLGAGTSVTSGIPLADKMVSKAAKWGYCLEKAKAQDDPRVVRSDWLPWLKSQKWYTESLSATENYPYVVQHLLQPAQNRKDFFQDILNPGIPPSEGYMGLADILHNGFVKTILTTNFDPLVLEAKIINKRPHHIDVVQTSADYIKISTSPTHPQEIFLHGSVEHYTDKNIIEEVESLDQDLVERLVPILRDHPLVVVGYRGGERSVMEHLLSNNAEKLDYLKHGVYWCVLKGTTFDDLPGLVRDFATAIGSNFQLVEIDGFDELIAESLATLRSDISSNNSSKSATTNSDELPLDMRPVRELKIADLDWPLLQSRVQQYCDVLDINIQIPPGADNAWWLEQFKNLHLAAHIDGVYTPTIAGELLFSKDLDIPKSIITVKGPKEWITSTFLLEDEDPGFTEEGGEIVISGNLWRQLDQIDNMLALVNRSFRLKGTVSENVRPYPPLAIKEVIVNALVHRDYQSELPLQIEIEPGQISITNPGGLVAEVVLEAGDEGLEALIRRRGGGVKGYRNPVIADLFYTSGKMDKKGSGLTDVCKWMESNAGDVKFGPDEVNECFKVTLFSRPEAVDEITDIASPLDISTARYLANILEMIKTPTTVWHAATEEYKVGGVWKKAESEWLPPFIVHGSKVYTFYNLEDYPNAFGKAIDEGTIEPLSIDEFSEGDDGKRLFVRLMNAYLFRHFESIGLIVDKKKFRAYFPADNDEERKVNYSGRLKKAARTVVKKRVNPTTGKLRYWEHQSFGFNLSLQGKNWNLMITPGYVFTWNGYKGLLGSERVNKLSTKRASRDYNNSVLNHLIFWSRMLSEGNQTSFTLKDYKVDSLPNPEKMKSILPIIEFSSTYPSAEVNEIANDWNRNDTDYFDELAELEDDIEALADETRKLAEEEASSDGK